MPEEEIQINLFNDAVASFRPRQDPTANFTLQPHEGSVRFVVEGKPVGDRYARYLEVWLDEKRIHRSVVSREFSKSFTKDLEPGNHTLRVTISSYVGEWLVDGFLVYSPTAPDISVEEINVLPVIGGLILAIGGGVGAWFLTDGFTKLPTFPDLAKINLPNVSLPF